MRFAYQAIAKPIANLFKGASKTDLALRFGPDVAYAAMAGTLFAPEGAGMGGRAAMMGEDLFYGVGSSLLGQGLGRSAGRRRAAAAMAGKKGPNARAEYHNTVNGWQTGGDMLGQMSMVALPRPVSQGVYEAAGERANIDAERASNIQNDMVEKQQLDAALATLQQHGMLGAATPMAALGAGPMLTTGQKQVI